MIFVTLLWVSFFWVMTILGYLYHFLLMSYDRRCCIKIWSSVKSLCGVQNGGLELLTMGVFGMVILFFDLDFVINGKVLSRFHTVMDSTLRYFYNSSLEQTSKSQCFLSFVLHYLYSNDSCILIHKVHIQPRLEHWTFIMNNGCIKNKL